MLSPPADLPEDVLVAAIARGWRVNAAAVTYRPVGFGSHHWEITDTAGERWFVTADELDKRRHFRDEPLDAAYDRLRAALATAAELRRHGAAFVVAPVPARDGGPIARVCDRFAVALHPFVDGQSFAWGGFTSPEHRRAALDLVVAVHAAPAEVRRLARVDGFAVPHRDELSAALLAAEAAEAAGAAGAVGAGEGGPYARAAAELLAAHAAPVRRLLARYDHLVARARARPDRRVLTHGEPHPGNTMLAAGGWLLIDWDTALMAPPERDLWLLDPGDGSIVDAYAATTGRAPDPAMLELYRIRWTLADIAVEARRFRAPHTGTADDHESWQILRTNVESLTARNP